MQTVDEALERLQSSAFRAKFHLSEQDKSYVREKGINTIRSHGQAFIAERLAPADPPHDGRQTPWRGHPIFIAQHACACCCRGCLNKWYKVPMGRALTPVQQEKILALLMAWISRQMEENK